MRRYRYRTRHVRDLEYANRVEASREESRAYARRRRAVPRAHVLELLALAGAYAAHGRLVGDQLLDHLYAAAPSELVADATVVELAGWSDDRHGVDYVHGWAHPLDADQLAEELRDAWTTIRRREART